MSQKIVYRLAVLMCFVGMGALIWSYSRTPVGHASPASVQFGAVVPDGKFALPEPLKNGEQDIVFRVKKEEAEKLAALAKRRCLPYRVTVVEVE